MSDTPDAGREAFEQDARELRALFVASREADLDRLGVAIAAGDFETARAIGHVFRGSGTTFGFPEASRLGQALEDAASRQDAGTALRLARELSTVLACPP